MIPDPAEQIGSGPEGRTWRHLSGADPEPASATHCVAPGRRLEPVRAEAEGFFAGSIARQIDARQPGGAAKTRQPRVGWRVSISSTAEIDGIAAPARDPGAEAIKRIRHDTVSG